MVKTAAEYQREYRERKKLNDATYLEREKNRVKKYRVPIDQMTKKDAKKTRENNKLYSFRYRERQRRKQKPIVPNIEILSPAISSSVTQSPTVSSTQSPTVSSTQVFFPDNSPGTSTRKSDFPLLVKMHFPSKAKRIIRSKALKTASNKIHNLKAKISKLNRQKSMFVKRCQRMKNKVKEVSTDSTCNSVNELNLEMTPRSKTHTELRKAGFSPRRTNRSIVKKLIMSNALIDEIKESSNENKNEKSKRVVSSIASGKVIKKYKCMTILMKETGITKRLQRGVKTKKIKLVNRKRMENIRSLLKEKVVNFLKRDDVSRVMPGKNDAKKVDGEKYQIRILNDYLGNLHMKFLSDEPGIKISRSSFANFRPKYIKLTSLISRNVCLCSKHQSMAMKLKCLRIYGTTITPNPETLLKSVTFEEFKVLLDEIKEDVIDYEQWQRVEENGKKRMRVVKVRKSKQDFTTIMEKEFLDFQHHSERVKQQYTALKNLKDNLPVGHVMVQMDFAENFTCQTLDEIQSAYWNATSVTLHPVVAYHKDETGKLVNKNFVFVSNVNSHNSTAVITIINKLIPELKSLIPNIGMVHYWTDSPSSQYRNKYIFNLVSNHHDKFGFPARWNFFESGHGKGPCDGIGGTSKRQASEAVKQGKCQIQDASDYFAWAVSNQKAIRYIYYTSEEYEETAESMPLKLSVIHGTMKLHAVCVIEGVLYIRDTSCYCTHCLTLTNMCEGWRNGSNGCPGNAVVNEIAEVKDGDQVLTNLQVDDFAVVIYDDNWYIGKVLETDQVERDVEMDFMENTNRKGDDNKFRWPTKPDRIWINFDKVVSAIDPPTPIGKSKRQYKFDTNVLNDILTKVDTIMETKDSA